MFTQKQLHFLEDSSNYQIIRITEDYIEFRSRNTLALLDNKERT